MAAKTSTTRNKVQQAAAKQKEAPKQAAPEPEDRPEDRENVQPEDTIVPRGKHPPEAVYVARDRKSGAEVSFDAWGRKLDSNGNVVAGDRQRAGDAEAKLIYRPPAQEPPAEFKPKAGVGATMTRSDMGGARSKWDNSILPGGGGGTPTGSYAVPNRGAMDTGNMFGASRWPATSRWEEGGTPHQPWRSPSQQSTVGPRQMQSYVPPSQRDVPNANMPYPPTGDSRIHIPPQPGDGGMFYDPYGGNYNGDPLSSTRSGAQYSPDSPPTNPDMHMFNIPGFGQLPMYAPPDPADLEQNALPRMYPIPGYGPIPESLVPDTPENFPSPWSSDPWLQQPTYRWRQPKVEMDRIRPLDLLTT